MVYIVVFMLLNIPSYDITKSIGNQEIGACSDLEEVRKISKDFYTSIGRGMGTALILLDHNSKKVRSDKHDKFLYVRWGQYVGTDMNLYDLLPSNFSGSFYLFDVSFRVNLSSISFVWKFTDVGLLPLPDNLKEIDTDIHRKEKPIGIKHIGTVMDIRYILWKDINLSSMGSSPWSPRRYYSYKYRCVFLGIEARRPEVIREFSNNGYDYLVFYQKGLNPTIGFHYLHTVSPRPESSPPSYFPSGLDLELSITINPFYMNELYLYKQYMVAGGHTFYKLIKTDASIYDVNLSVRYNILRSTPPNSTCLVLSMRHFKLMYKSENLGKIRTFKDTTLSIGVSVNLFDVLRRW